MSKDKFPNFTREGIERMAERLLRGEMTDEELHLAAENTEKILREKGSDLKVKYMGFPYHFYEEKALKQSSLSQFNKKGEKDGK